MWKDEQLDELDEVKIQKIKYVTLDEHFQQLGMSTYTQLDIIARCAVKLFEPPFKRGGIRLERPEEKKCFENLRAALLEAGFSWEELT